jgi:hypothetical protein
VFTAEHPLHLSLPDLFFQSSNLFLDFDRGFRIPRLGHLKEDTGIIETTGMCFPLGNDVGECSTFFENRLGFFLILPELIRRGQRLEFGSARLFASDVKDASRGSRPGPLTQRVSL